MINFFRNIRRKFADNNQFLKYSSYAIGEIVLVVVGILIAISINNWNEERKNRNEENTTLINLKSEFIENQNQLEILIEIKKRIAFESRAYLEIITNDSISIHDKIVTKLPGTNSKPWSATYAALNSLLNTGKIENIRNDSLKILLTNWLNLVNRFEVTENKYVRSSEKYWDYLNQKSYRPVVNFKRDSNNFPGTFYPNSTESKRDSLQSFLINDFEFYNLIAQNLHYRVIELLNANEIISDSIQILGLIDKELAERAINFD